MSARSDALVVFRSSSAERSTAWACQHGGLPSVGRLLTSHARTRQAAQLRVEDRN